MTYLLWLHSCSLLLTFCLAWAQVIYTSWHLEHSIPSTLCSLEEAWQDANFWCTRKLNRGVVNLLLSDGAIFAPMDLWAILKFYGRLPHLVNEIGACEYGLRGWFMVGILPTSGPALAEAALRSAAHQGPVNNAECLWSIAVHVQNTHTTIFPSPLYPM